MKHSLPRVHWAWVILANGFYVYLVMYGIRLGYGVILPSMNRALGLTGVEAGVIAGSFFPSYVIFALILGVLTDLRGYRVVMTLFSIPMAMGAFLMAFISNMVGGMFSQALIGVGAGIGFVPFSALIQKWFGEERRGFALGISQAAPHAGLAVMAAVLPSLVDGYGWQAGWLLLGLLGVSLVVVNWLCIRDSPDVMGLRPWGESEKVEASDRHVILSMPFVKQVISTKSFWLVGLSYLCMAYATYVPLTFLVMHAMESGMEYASAGLLTTTFSLVGIPGSLFVGSFSDRIGRRVSIIVSELIMSMGLAGLAYGGAGPPAFVSSAVFGFSYGGIFALYAACSMDYFPREVAGLILGLWTLFYGVAGTFSPVVSGYVAEMYGGFASSFLLASTITVFSAALMLVAGAPAKRR